MTGRVVAVSRSAEHSFSKGVVPEVALLAGLGVEGDAHAGVTVRHRSRVAADPTQANLRQVHLIHRELLDELRAKGFALGPGELGENVLTEGLDLLALPTGSLLRLGGTAVVRVTGLRNPCAQIEACRPGLLREVLRADGQGRPVRRAGIMAVVVAGGPVRPGDGVEVTPPLPPHVPLDRV